jgi:AraC family transcriptional activator of pobA
LKRKIYTDNYPLSQFSGLYGDKSKHAGDGLLFSELLETRSSQFDWKISPHTHPGLLQVFFIDEGTFELQGPGEKRMLYAPCIVLIPPTILHGFDFGKSARGRILSIADELLNEILKDARFVSPMLNTLVCLTDFIPYSHEDVKAALVRLHDELFTNGAGKNIMVWAGLQQLFIMFYRIWENSINLTTEYDPIKLGLFEKFQRLTREVNAKDTVKNIAAELAITPVHLNRICNTVTGKSAGQLMDEHLLEQSKQYLVYTSYSVSEVAYLLKFDYPNYFARFFKKHASFTPSQFRKRLQETF